jgi:hypothetical protein
MNRRAITVNQGSLLQQLLQALHIKVCSLLKVQDPSESFRTEFYYSEASAL